MKLETEIILQFADEENEDLLAENFEIPMSQNRQANIKKKIVNRMRKFIRKLEKK